VLAAACLAACSYIPFVGSSDGPHLTNAAVEACKRKADDLGYEGVGERQTTPEAEGRYTVVLDVRQQEGYGQITCTFDPSKGAEIKQEKPSNS